MAESNQTESEPYKPPLRIILTGGGSGGPTLPLIALAEEIKKQNLKTKFLFIGSKNGLERKMVEQKGITFAEIPSGKMRRYWSWRNFIDPFFILFGGIAGFFHLLNFKPQIVISAGSFVSVPVAYAAWVLNLPHLILQMDLRPGLANRLMAPVSKALVFNFEKTAKHFPSISLKRKIGPVVRQEIYTADANQANERFGLNPKKPLILITGGGQGAGGLNKAISPYLKHWLINFQVVHLTGLSSRKNSKNNSTSFSHPDYHPIEVVYEGMGDLIAKSEIVLTRAGMGIIGELSVLKKDSILVPLPGTHQEDNAKFIHENHATNFVSQDFLKNQGIEWWYFYTKHRIRGEMGRKLHKLFPEKGTKEFAQFVFEILNKD